MGFFLDTNKQWPVNTHNSTKQRKAKITTNDETFNPPSQLRDKAVLLAKFFLKYSDLILKLSRKQTIHHTQKDVRGQIQEIVLDDLKIIISLHIVSVIVN